MKIDEVITIAEIMIGNDHERDDAFRAYSNMYHLAWKLPKELDRVDWLRKYVATEPHDAIEAGVRVLAALRPSIKKHPLASDEANRERANMEEKVLAWHLWAADRRRPVSIVSDVVKSSLLYSCSALFITDLENEIGIRKSMGQSTKRLEMARNYGRFVIQSFNPIDVHTRRSSYGTEAVLLCQRKLASEVITEWGNLAKNLKATSDAGGYVRYYDYWDLDNRAVWVSPEAQSAVSAESMLTIMKPTPHDMNFLPWVALMGGTDLENDEQHRYHPMLYPMWFSRSWETLNVVKTLTVSEAISHAASPNLSDEGPNLADAYIEVGDPTKIAKPAPGNTLKPLPKNPLDPALYQITGDISGEMQRATVSRILMGGDVPSGTSYSSLNLATQTAVGALKPAKELAEKTLAEMFRTMLLWVVHTNEPLMAYGNREKSSSYGENYVISPDEIEPSAIYIDVNLIPDVPTDRLQRANAASIMVQYGYPREYALEDLGVEDPQTAMRQWYFERYIQQQFDLMMQQQQQQVQLDGQKDMAMFQAQMQQQMQQEQMQQQQVQQAQMMQQQGGAPQQGVPDEETMNQLMQGQGYNPAMGGTPAVMGMPPDQALREMVNQQTFGGEEPVQM